MGIYTFSGVSDAPTVKPNFNGTVKFTPSKAVYSNTNITGALNITFDLTDAVVGAVAIVRLTSNGVNIPTFSASIKALGVPVWTNTNNTVNVLQFLYDGVDVWYTILPQPGVVGTGTTAPVADPKTTLSGFSINTAGDRFNYNTTLATNGFTGTLTVAGTPRTLTHISSGVASFNGASAKVGEVVTFTLSASVPESLSSFTSVTVTNNSTVAAGTGAVALRTQTYTLKNGATVASGRFNLPTTTSTLVVNEPINSQAPFEVIWELDHDNEALLFSTDNTDPVGFGTSSNAFLMVLPSGQLLYALNNTGNTSVMDADTYWSTGVGLPGRLRFIRNGSNIDVFHVYGANSNPATPVDSIYQATDVVGTLTNILSGKTNIYVKMVNRFGTDKTGMLRVYT